MAKKVRKFAEGTTVSVINSRLEIERTILRFAGPKADFAYIQREGFHDIIFVAHDRRVRFSLPQPTVEEAERGAMRRGEWHKVTDKARLAAWIDGESRRRWRALLLAIKAKLVVVESGSATFEEEFLAHIVNKAGMTIYQSIQQAQVNGVKLLEAASPDNNVIDVQIVKAGNGRG